MTEEILAFLREVRHKYVPSPASILDIGSRNVNGSSRSVWEACPQYIGVDLEPGEGVDIVADALTFNSGTRYDLVLCCETLEHTTNPLAIADTCKRHVAANGFLVITTPDNGFEEHGYPRDYWRIMPHAYADLLYAGWHLLELVQVQGPSLCAIGQRGEQKQN